MSDHRLIIKKIGEFMIKECPVVLNNSAVTVILYDKVEVQVPSIRRKAKTVFVEYVDGRYEVVEKPEPVVQLEEKEVVVKKPQKKIAKNEVSNIETATKDVIPENDIIADAE